MRTFLLSLTAVAAAFAVTAPSITPAAAERVIIREHHRHHPPMAFGRFHREHDHKTVIIKKHD